MFFCMNLCFEKKNMYSNRLLAPFWQILFDVENTTKLVFRRIFKSNKNKKTQILHSYYLVQGRVIIWSVQVGNLKKANLDQILE